MAYLDKKLYHATLAQNLPSIIEHGLLSSHYGAIHGETDTPPNQPSVFLSRKPQSDNLHVSLFEQGPESVVVLEIDASFLDETLFTPDDFFLSLFVDMVTDPSETEEEQITNLISWLDISDNQARDVIGKMSEATSVAQEQDAVRELWTAYLNHEDGGEVAYAGDVPASAIIGWRPLEPAHEIEGVERF